MERIGSRDGGEQTTLHAGQTARCTAEKLVVQAGLADAPRFVRRIGFDPAHAERIAESFDGAELGPAFEQMPLRRFANVDGAAEYRNPPENGGRAYIRTRATDFCDRDFIFEATIKVRLDSPAPDDLSRQVFVGIGDGVPNADFYDAVSTGLTLGYVVDSGLLQVVIRRPDTKVGFDQNTVVMQMATGMEPGRHRFRFWKRGNWMGFEVDADFKGKFQKDFSSRPINLNTLAPLLNATDSRLFVGTGNCAAGAIRIEDLSVTFSAPAHEEQTTIPDAPPEPSTDK